MTVLFVLSDCILQHGSFQSVVALCKHLSKDFQVSTPIVIPKKNSGIEYLLSEGLNYKYIRSFNWTIPSEKKAKAINKLVWNIKRRINLFSIINLVIYIKKIKPDIIHINSSDSYVGAIAARYCKIPLVWHLREFLEEDHGVEFWNRTDAEKIINYASRVIVVSDSLFQKYAQYSFSDKMVRIYNGIDVEKYLCKERNIFQTGIVNIAIVGRVCAGKGQIIAIEAIGELKKQGIIEICLNIYGDGEKEYFDYLKNTVKELDIENQVHFWGYVKDISECYKKNDIALICSKKEAFGRTTVEAMLAGCLVVGADTAATKELIKDKQTGFLYEQADPVDLSRKLMTVMNNRITAVEISKAGQQYMLSNMSASRNAKEIYDLYSQIISE